MRIYAPCFWWFVLRSDGFIGVSYFVGQIEVRFLADFLFFALKPEVHFFLPEGALCKTQRECGFTYQKIRGGTCERAVSCVNIGGELGATLELAT